MNIFLTSPISFPGLGIEGINPPDGFSIPGTNFEIKFYGVIIAIGVLLAVTYCLRRAKQFGVTQDDILNLVLICLPSAIVGARLYYVIFEWDQFFGPGIPWYRFLDIRSGGLAIYGGVIAGFLTAYLFSRRRKISFWALADCCVQGLFIGQAIGRWGNFMNREAFGAATELPWRMRLWTSATTYMDVHPTFLYESLWNVIGLLLLYFVVSRARRFDGENTCFYFIWYGLGRFWIEGLRTDSLYLFHWTLFGQRIRVSQALSLVMVLVCAGILVYQFKVKKADGSNLFVKRVQQTTEAEEAAAEPAAPDEKK